MKKGRIFVATIVTCSLLVVPVYAEPGSEQLQQQKQKTQQEVNSLQVQLKSILNEIESLKNKIKEKNLQLDEIGEQLDLAEQLEYEQYEAMKIRIRYMYEEGTSDKTLEKILTSQSMGEILNQVEYVNGVHTYDRKMLDDYVTTKKEVAQKQDEFQQELVAFEEIQEECAEQQLVLVEVIAEKREELAGIDEQLVQAVEREAQEARAIQEAQEEANRQAQEAINNQTSSGNSNTNTSNTTTGSGNPSSNTSNSGTSNNQSSNESTNTETNNPSDSSNTGNDNTVDAGNDAPANTGNNNSSNTTDSNDSGSSNSSTSTGVTGQDIVNYACKFIGNPYVYGGTSLTSGIDCSAFTRAVYAHYGYSIPRTSALQRSTGTEVSYSNARAGDIICYSGHVAIYMGNGKIVHASNSAAYPAGGIKISSNAQYRTILSVRRIIK